MAPVDSRSPPGAKLEGSWSMHGRNLRIRLPEETSELFLPTVLYTATLVLSIAIVLALVFYTGLNSAAPAD